ncbi:Uma2 family endonuclease [Candidatus Chlorohelix sp.]|uniref:Uma2 family endonuclease n=1 Tax=Candidatus Chlorohelix sp. TaxID=3139201 RepID=UPI003022C816
MAQNFQNRYYTLEEYLSLEKQSLEKHEYYKGNIYLMAGGTPNHSLISSNLNRVLGNALEDRPCRVYTSDLQILVKAHGLVTYPDVSVVCGAVEHTSEDSNLVTNPILIVEVLSPSTASYDQTTKFHLYKGLASLVDYVLVDSRGVNVIYFHKLSFNEWVQRVYTDLGEVVVFESLQIEVPLERIYAKVEFDSAPRLLRELS